jgi:N-(2-amino-2-carboxyethyl)-L-glutamate synthase
MILKNVGNTPLLKIDFPFLNIKNLNLFCKLEYYNPMGSIKDRAANYIIKKLIEDKIINKDSILVESSSGNFGIALSAYSKFYGIKFICVIDKMICPLNEMILKLLKTNIIKITEADDCGGYLLNRLKKVAELQEENPNVYWINQYGNFLNAEAYYNTLGNEICDALDRIDYIFVGVSSGGTITGISRKVKERFPAAKVIAVDVVGSVIFGGEAKKRNIPGIGSSKVPKILKYAKIDDIVLIDELSAVKICHKLLKEAFIFAGGSSGTVVSAIQNYFQDRRIDKSTNVVAIIPDRGERYYDSIYNMEWCDKIQTNLRNEDVVFI